MKIRTPLQTVSDLERFDPSCWFHSFNSPVKIRGDKDTVSEVEQWNIPADFFTDKKVIDIGPCDGFYSLYAKSHGAKQVLGVDRYPRKTFKYLLDKFEIENVELIYGDVQQPETVDIILDTYGQFDVCIFAGVLYHLIHPMLGLQQVNRLLHMSGKILAESHISLELSQKPPQMKLAAEFYPTNELNNDTSNWWGPNALCLLNMIDVAGFGITQHHHVAGSSRYVAFGEKKVEYETPLSRFKPGTCQLLDASDEGFTSFFDAA